jgi:hypothetical protein
LNFLGGFSKNVQISNFITIRPEGAELFHAIGQRDRQTDMTKLVAFRNFANAPKNQREIFELGMYRASFLALAPSLAVDLVASNNGGTVSSGDQFVALFRAPFTVLLSHAFTLVPFTIAAHQYSPCWI